MIPKVSVVLSTHNRVERLKRAVTSILAQSFADFELIIVDDASIDETEELVKKFMEMDERVSYIKRDLNFGTHTRPKNEGTKAAKTDFIAYFDDDNVMMPDHLAILYKYMDQSGVDVVYGQSIMVDESMRNVPMVSVTSDINDPRGINIFQQNFIDTNQVLCRKKAIEDIGGWDETLPRFADWNLFVRLKKVGAKFLLVPHIITEYHVHKEMNQGKHPQFMFDTVGCKIWPEKTLYGPAKKKRVATYHLTKDRIEYTIEAFNALKEKTQYPFDMYIVDNGSKDNTVDWIRAFAKQFNIPLREIDGIKENTLEQRKETFVGAQAQAQRSLGLQQTYNSQGSGISTKGSSDISSYSRSGKKNILISYWKTFIRFAQKAYQYFGKEKSSNVLEGEKEITRTYKEDIRNKENESNNTKNGKTRNVERGEVQVNERVYVDKITESSEQGQQRIRSGAQIGDGETLRAVSDKEGSGSSHKLQQARQQIGELDVVSNQQGASSISSITLIKNKENVGISKGSNQALDAMGVDNYDIIIKVDNDCRIWTPGWLEVMVDIYERYPTLILSPTVEGLVDNPGGVPRQGGYMRIAHLLLGIVPHVGGIFCAAPSSAYQQFRWPENDFLHSNQDWQFSQACRQRGYTLAYIENLRCEHIDSTSGQKEKFKDYFELRKKEQTTRYGGTK